MPCGKKTVVERLQVTERKGAKRRENECRIKTPYQYTAEKKHFHK